jgi:hypothetical protein
MFPSEREIFLQEGNFLHECEKHVKTCINVEIVGYQRKIISPQRR